jgi:hypothetical protein
MHDQLGVRESLHHHPGAAGMVEVDVGDDHVIDALGAEAARSECRQRLRHDFEIGGVDEGGAAVALDQVDGGQQRSHAAGIEGVDPVVVVDQRIGHGLFRHGCGFCRAGFSRPGGDSGLKSALGPAPRFFLRVGPRGSGLQQICATLGDHHALLIAGSAHGSSVFCLIRSPA